LISQGVCVSGVACQAIAWRRRPLKQFLDEAGQAGYEGSELTSWQAMQWGRHHHLRTELEHAGLPLVAFYHSARLCCPDVAKEEFRESVQAVEMARSLGARYIVLGNPPKHREHVRTGLKTLQLSLNRLGEACSRKGIILVYQPHYGGPVQTPEEVSELMDGTDSGLVSLCLDTAHIALGGGDPSGLMRQWGHRVRYIQIKDLRVSPPGWGERMAWLVHYARLGSLGGYFRGLYPLQQGLRAVSSVMFTTPGAGRLNFHGFRDAMESVGYAGWLTVELDAPLFYPGRAMADGLQYTRSTFDLPKNPS